MFMYVHMHTHTMWMSASLTTIMMSTRNLERYFYRI